MPQVARPLMLQPLSACQPPAPFPPKSAMRPPKFWTRAESESPASELNTLQIWAARQQSSSSGSGANNPTSPRPTDAYVAVTVCVENTQLAPNLLSIFKLDLSAAIRNIRRFDALRETANEQRTGVSYRHESSTPQSARRQHALGNLDVARSNDIGVVRRRSGPFAFGPAATGHVARIRRDGRSKTLRDRKRSGHVCSPKQRHRVCRRQLRLGKLTRRRRQPKSRRCQRKRDLHHRRDSGIARRSWPANAI